MLLKEEYKRELIRMWDSLRNNYKGEYNCFGVKCPKCPLYQTVDNCDEALGFFEVIETVERWGNEHPQKKYEVPQILYDALSLLAKYGFSIRTADGMTIEEYLENCEVVDKIKINERGTNEQIKE